MTRRPSQKSNFTAPVFRLNPIAASVRAMVTGSMLLSIATPAAAELPVPSAVWASMGGATREVVGNTMNINQLSDRVILNWDRFNVSADSTVNFHQKTTDIALNKIHDQNPSEILGTVNADGTIYLVNTNGIVFGENSQVNARALVASTMNVGFEDTFDKENINDVALTDDRAAFVGNGQVFEKDANGNFKLDADGNKIPIRIHIKQGAHIKSQEGGRIMVLAPNILNEGEVESPGGQVIMAAATDKVFLADASEEDGVRGLLVEVKTGGKVENIGKIAAERGNVTLMGFAVNQNGRVSATTASNVNGSIRLLAREGGFVENLTSTVKRISSTNTTRTEDSGDGLDKSGQVVFGEGSVTEVLPDNNSASALKTDEQPLSKVEVVAHKVNLKSGSSIVAPGGIVDITATRTPASPVADNVDRNDARILVDAGAKIDVSGVDTATRTMESNVVDVELRNFQLADAPLQKNGVLKGETIKVDIREGTPLTDMQPYVDAIPQSVGERLSNGGSIVLKSEGDVIVEDGAVLDISGGKVTFLDGIIQTTKLLAGGRVIDISQADPLQTYDGIYGQVKVNYKKWGQTFTYKIQGGVFGQGRFEKGYVEGKSAGTLDIRANTVVFDGELRADVVNGRLQRELTDLARGGILNINTGFTDSNVQDVIFGNSRPEAFDYTLDSILTRDGNDVPLALAMQAGQLFASGVAEANFVGNGKVTVEAGSTLKLTDAGKLTLTGGQIDVLGNIQGSGAHVELNTRDTNTQGLDGDITVADGAQILLQGQWVNDFARQANLDDKTLIINGGIFSARMGGDNGGQLNLAKGSRVNVSGGAWLKADGSLQAGDAGEISVVAEPDVDNVAANVYLNGVLEAYGIDKGGKFTARANGVAIRREEIVNTAPGVQPLQISTGFFGRGGFAEFDISANTNGLTVAEGATISLSQQNRVLGNGFSTYGNADSIEAISTLTVLEPLLRAPSSLTLRADHSAGANPDSRLLIERGAAIVADQQSEIRLVSDSSLVMDGSITAQGGLVSMSIVPDQSPIDPTYVDNQGIWLGESAIVDVSGGSEIMTDGLGRRFGEVYDGGRFIVDAKRGFFAAKDGSSINVSGTQDVLHIPTATVQGVMYTAQTVGSHAGTVDITAAEGIFLDGQMSAKGGNAAGTAGGTLQLVLNINNRADPNIETGTLFPSAPSSFVVTQHHMPTLGDSFSQAGDALPGILAGTGHIAADQVVNSGFDSLNLATVGSYVTVQQGGSDKKAQVGNDAIVFKGDVDLQLRNGLALDTSNFAWERNDAADSGVVNLEATRATLGSDTFRQSWLDTAGGDGRLTVQADLIDLVGGAATQGFNTVQLVSEGDIRLKGIRLDSLETDFVGEFKTYSKLELSADQVYPTSLTDFTLAVSGDDDGTLTVNPGGDTKPVLSALGKMTLQAPNIVQNGTLRAPQGEIVLDAVQEVSFGADSLTSVSAAGTLIPLGETQAGLEWLFPLAGTGVNLNVNDVNLQLSENKRSVIIHSPEKKITVDADRITREEGAIVDLSGGGDMLSFEFVPGDGGSRDVLAGNGSFAILPGIGNYAPFDQKLSPESGLKTGDSLYLSGVAGLAAGTYTLLPARYALLPGAFLVTPLATSNVVVGGNSSRVDGTPIVSGYRTVAGTDIRDQRWSEYVIEPGSIAKTRSEYNLRLASEFFATQAANNDKITPRLAQDAGQLVLSAVSALNLPTVIAEVTGLGRGGLVDIVAGNLAVVSEKTGTAGVVELLSSDIDKFKVDSLAFGAIRTIDTDTGQVDLDVRANTVTVGRDTRVEAPELLMAATDKVEVKENARVVTRGRVAEGTNQTVLNVDGDGALLRASSGKQAQLIRTDSHGSNGDLLIASGALVDAGTGSLLLDASRKNSLQGELALDGGSLNLGAEQINLGETDGLVSGLSLDNRQLSALRVAELVLTSRGMVNLYGLLAQTDENGQVLTDDGGVPLALQFGDLVIDADGLAGFNNAGKTATLQADSVRFTNGGSLDSAQGNGSGSLLLSAGRLTFDKGQYALSGFGDMQINAAQGVFGLDVAGIQVTGDLSLSTPFVTAFNGASTTLDATGHALTLASLEGAAAMATGIAGTLQVEADSLAVDTALLYKAGAVGLSSLQGDLTLGNNARVDVSGAVVQAGLSQARNLDAGRITLMAMQQNVVAENGSQLLLNAVNDKAKAGVLTAKAGGGEVLFNGTLAANGGSKSQGGRAVIDSGSLSGGFDALNQPLAAGGFSGGIDFRLRNGDIVLSEGQTVAAHDIKLTADSGAITVEGMLNASDVQGGSVELNAEDNLTLAATANILANSTGTDQAGGKVQFASLDLQSDGAGIAIIDGARIDVLANGAGEEGGVSLRAERLGNDIAVSAIADGTISGDSRVDLEAVRVYNDTVITAADQNSYDNDNRSFVNNLNDRFGADYALLTGVEVRSSGDLTVADSWDLSSWRYGADNLPGSLVLRAGGNLFVNAGLSDGFSFGMLDTLTNGSFGVTDMLRTDQSWSYKLVAGADLNSADSSALKQAPSLLQATAAGDFKLADDTSVRTGTGDIEVLAARDIVYGNSASTIYTAGRADTVNRYGSGGEDLAIFIYAEFAKDGGDISLNAGRDIIAQPTDQLLSDALVRNGNWSRNQDHGGERPTIWGLAVGTAENGIEPKQHRQSLAAFGGGDISVRAGGKVSDVSVVIPTSGKQVGEKTNPAAPGDFNFTTNVNQVQGGGNLTVDAGGDIEGGVFYVDGGQADLRTDGSLTAGNNQGLNPILALGDAQFTVTAGKAIAVEAIVDPMFVTLPGSADVDNQGPQGPNPTNRFFRYSADSAVALTALTGNVSLTNDPARLNQATNSMLGTDWKLILPATFRAYALNGDLTLEKSFSMLPAPQGGLELYAEGNIGGLASVLLSDTEVAALPSALFPIQDGAVTDVLSLLDPTLKVQSHALNPVHADDEQPVLISTGSGSIGGGGNNFLSFTLAKAAEIRAGKDIFNTTFKMQNIRPDDVSTVSAGRDIRFTLTRNQQTAAIKLGDQRIEVAGPGDLVLLAGRNIDMGASNGILSVGDLNNPALADQGANITALASLGDGRIDVNAFAEGVLKQTDETSGQPVTAYLQYRERFVREVRSVTGNDALPEADADTVFNALNAVDRARVEAKLLPSVQSRFLAIVKEAAVDSAKALASFKAATRPDDKVTLKAQADQAEMKLLAVIETLFPGTTLLDGVDGISVTPDGGVSLPEGRSAGDILDAVNASGRQRPVLGGLALFMSTAQTQDGGDVNVFTPNGGVNVGLTVADIGLDPKPEAESLGLIAKKQGNINVLVRDDIEVNVQRIYAVQGDVLAGSTEGDVDAGRAAKTDLASPSLKVSSDQSGLPLLEVAPVFAGGGIKAPAGIGTLFALRGTINAGEAGVGANGLFFATPVLQNGDNVDVGSGGGVGVPAASTGSVAAGLSGVSNVAAAVSKSLDESANMGKDVSDGLSKAAALGLLSIDLLGFGE
ncbi:filamentous haemagglutinin family protein [Methylomonas methanica]|uniref:Filamentous hemagglutinin family outer membrane protein n=1 Tax=Methylomonas methanica (strain DSM 25384 / MC09) TaxID=857087 RepID=G0A766_METMM|nr:filamentous haemagglutinin family protein [Methylomonas methanica]AEF99359.1 filamentous hemagglutinin family outer membrane protein [Methylomonas methanica MC09]